MFPKDIHLPWRKASYHHGSGTLFVPHVRWAHVVGSKLLTAGKTRPLGTFHLSLLPLLWAVPGAVLQLCHSLWWLSLSGTHVELLAVPVSGSLGPMLERPCAMGAASVSSFCPGAPSPAMPGTEAQETIAQGDCAILRSFPWQMPGCLSLLWAPGGWAQRALPSAVSARDAVPVIWVYYGNCISAEACTVVSPAVISAAGSFRTLLSSWGATTAALGVAIPWHTPGSLMLLPSWIQVCFIWVKSLGLPDYLKVRFHIKTQISPESWESGLQVIGFLTMMWFLFL